MTRFFFVGCWNNDHCDGDTLDYREAVFRKINKNAGSYNFGVIAGDNIYSHTVFQTDSNGQQKKKKVYYYNTWQYAKEALRRFSIPLYGTIGNHDVANQRVLAEQLAIMSNPNGYDNPNNFQQMPSPFLGPMNCYVQHISNNVRLIFIDTNAFSVDRPKIYNQDHYQYPSVEQYLRYRNPSDVLQWLKSKLRGSRSKDYNGWTIVVGHEPIISIKEKASKGGSLKVSNLADYTKLLHILTAQPNTIYMSADVHSFQAWNMEHKGQNLPVIVAGTGGASPDNPPLSLQTKYGYDDQTMELVAAKSPYGYCDVDVSDDMLTITYLPLGCGQRRVVLTYQKGANKMTLSKTQSQSASRESDQDCITPTNIDPKYCTPNKVIEGGR